MVLVKGLSVQDCKRMPSLGCLFSFFGLGMAVGVWYLGRMIVKDTDGSFLRGSNPLPYLNIKVNEQTKLFSPRLDYSKLQAPADKPQLPVD